MTKNRRILFRGMVVCFVILYSFSMLMNEFVFITVLKPFATILAFIALRKMVTMSDDFEKAHRTICYAFLIWAIIDSIGAIGELFCFYNKIPFGGIYNVEVLFYFFVRIMVLVASTQLYYGLTRKYNRFQRIADIY